MSRFKFSNRVLSSVGLLASSFGTGLIALRPFGSGDLQDGLAGVAVGLGLGVLLGVFVLKRAAC